jgi:phosphate transport system substrate-binding protein
MLGSQAGGERPGRWDFGTDRTRRRARLFFFVHSRFQAAALPAQRQVDPGSAFRSDCFRRLRLLFRDHARTRRALRVAVDALAVYVHKDNPILCLTLQQLDQIFSSTRQGSGGKSIKTWGDIGMTGEWATKPISLYGRNSISGTYEFFKQTALYGGDYKEDVKQQPGSAAVVQSVANDKFAIGYSGLGYKTDGVRTVPLAAFYGAKCYDTTAEATYSGKYPIARYLYIYLNKKPNEPLAPLRAEFIKYILSKDGQTQTEEGGYFPITNEFASTT